MALLVFGLLAFDETVTEQNESVASLYGYFASTVILIVFVRTLPPYSRSNWLEASLREDAARRAD